LNKLLYNILIPLNVMLRVIIIVDNYRVFITSMLIKVNPFTINIVQSNRYYEG